MTRFCKKLEVYDINLANLSIDRLELTFQIMTSNGVVRSLNRNPAIDRSNISPLSYRAGDPNILCDGFSVRIKMSKVRMDLRISVPGFGTRS